MLNKNIMIKTIVLGFAMMDFIQILILGMWNADNAIQHVKSVLTALILDV